MEAEPNSPSSLNVGATRILSISDGEARMPAASYFQGSDEVSWESHRSLLDADGNYIFPLGCFVVDAPGRRILVDTGLGPADAGFAKGGGLRDGLASEGIATDSIDAIFVTHFHADHVGGITSDGDLVFSNANVLLTEAEFEFWDGGPPPNQFLRRDVLDAIRNRVEFVSDGDLIAKGVNVIGLPGHTPGSAGLVVSAGEKRALLLGDAIACPAQVEEAEWTSMSDVDPGLSRRTREALWREIEGGEAAVGASHFPDLKFGRILNGEGRRYFQAIS